jgi:hypothetical protein
MIKLSELLNGIYLPLEFMESRKELELLVKEAEGKKIFIDNFQDANNEIKEYIEKGLWNVVIASRNPLDMKRDFKIIQLDWMFDEDGIIKYLGEKNIEIEKDLLKEIKDKISYPIKLRILREYLLRKELKILNRKSLKEIPEFPGELKDWYDRFVWKDFGKEERGLAFILSLLRENADIGVLSAISNISEGKIDESIGKMSGILNKVNECYSIFHDTFKDFCAGENGKLKDKRNLHKKIGNYYESLLGIPIKSAGIKARFYGMYHYRNCFDKENFMKVFSIDLVSDLINLGEWIEAKENLEFSLNCEITARERERIVGKLGIVRCIARQMRDKSADLNANEVLANLERDDAVKKTYAKVKELCFKFGLDKLCSKRGFADDCIPTLIILYQSTENKGYLMTLAQIIYDAPDEVKQEFINMVPEIEEFLK